jgi:hypothetical protein
LLQPLSDIYFGSLHDLSDTVAGKLTALQPAMSPISPMYAHVHLPLASQFPIVFQTSKEKFLTNNTIKKLRLINYLLQSVCLEQLKSMSVVR